MEYGCIGNPLSHSFSREIHAAFAPYTYELCELAKEDLESFFRKREFKGINVTIPYKQAVIPFLDEIDRTAAEIGAVNTVVNRGGRLIGYNTDAAGLEALIGKIGVPLTGKTVAILGTGGTSRTAGTVAKRLGASEILFVSRTQNDLPQCVTYGELSEKRNEIQYLINTTPVGMYPEPDAEPVSVKAFPVLVGVADAVYNPLRTNLVQAAASAGIPAEGGLFMLVFQAVRAAELFLGHPFPADTAQTVFQNLLREKRNLVLIGMPASGKTTVGRLLASSMNRQFIDTDAEIEKQTGCDVRTIFRTRGEAEFRRIESSVCHGLAQTNGTVIATGGGAVLDPANLNTLRQNGLLIWLDRDPASLPPTPERPLASDKEAILRLYRERKAIYQSACDVRIPVTGTAEEVAEQTRKEFAAQV